MISTMNNAMCMPVHCPASSMPLPISATVTTEEMWRKFHRFTMEMIVTKSGRKMFPKLEYNVTGLNPSALYAMSVTMERVDDHKYKFSAGEWHTNGMAEPRLMERPVIHYDGVKSGEYWMDRKNSFDRIRLTNNANTSDYCAIVLQSMHKYIPVLKIYEVPCKADVWIDSTMPNLDCCHLVASIKHPFTSFVAVTAYQNLEITRLKIDMNPFAKGFRDGSDRKRNSRSPPHNEEPSPKRSPEVAQKYPFPSHMPFPKDFQESQWLFNPMWYDMNPMWYMPHPQVYQAPMPNFW
ncbi:unnamed protein product [Auanema sp. JU1783]|nr:unnamed protein product [Auanema sp. JU1783]